MTALEQPSYHRVVRNDREIVRGLTTVELLFLMILPKREGEMDFLVMLEESPEQSPVLARVDSVPAEMDSEHRGRDVVTLYGTPSTESLALALAAAVESRRRAGNSSGAFRHLGVWP
ncbi:MAG: hypothetical protein ABR543_01535, partial [Gemmatimonadaceae bacterium]